MGLFGTAGGFHSYENPYAQIAYDTPYAGANKVKRSWQDILSSGQRGDYSNMPGMGMFDTELAKSNKMSYENANPLAYTAAGAGGGPLAERVRQLQAERSSEDINSQRYGFAQNQLGEARQGLVGLANMKNQFNLQKALGAGGLFAQSRVWQGPTQGPLTTLLGAAIGAAGEYGGKAAASDERLKDNIRDTEDGLDKLNEIEIKDYDWKGSGASDTGVIAQELYKVYPSAVLKGGDNPQDDPWKVNYIKLVPLLIKSVQELSAQVEELTQRVNNHEHVSTMKVGR